MASAKTKVNDSTLRDSITTIEDVYMRASSMKTGKGKFTTINELTDQVPAVRPHVLRAAVDILEGMAPIPSDANLVLSEEDKGAITAGMFAERVNLPLAMARHNFAYIIPGTLQVSLSMEYMNGHLSVNGLKKGDNVIIIDDTLSTGGTMAALVTAVHEFGARVSQIRCLVEKVGYGGRSRLAEVTKVPIYVGLRISLDSAGRITIL